MSAGDPQRLAVYVDGQNLFQSAMEAFGTGYHWPNYDCLKIASLLLRDFPGAVLGDVSFYTGVPTIGMDPFWHGFWNNKLAGMGRAGVRVFRGRVNASRKEKGVDVRIAIDLLRDFIEGRYDIAAIVSQDRDFDAAVASLKDLSRKLGRPVRVMCAYPFGPGTVNRFGIQGALARRIRKAEYDPCLDPRRYGPAGLRPGVPGARISVDGPQVAFVRAGLGMTREQFGFLLGAPAERVKDWEKGREPIPDPARFWLGPLVTDRALFKRFQAASMPWRPLAPPAGPEPSG